MHSLPLLIIFVFRILLQVVKHRTNQTKYRGINDILTACLLVVAPPSSAAADLQ